MKAMNTAAAFIGYAAVFALAAHIGWIHWKCG
jgi:hypothetical protein